MLHRLEFHAMGCDMLAVVESETAPQLLSHVPEWFEEWEQSISRFLYDSELTQLNQTHGQPIQVSEALWDVFQAARKAEQMTDGLVTPTLLGAILEAGYDRTFDALPHLSTPMADSVSTISQPLTAIAFDVSARNITLPEGMGLDFGGVAKGWAAHQAMKRLQVEGPRWLTRVAILPLVGHAQMEVHGRSVSPIHFTETQRPKSLISMRAALPHLEKTAAAGCVMAASDITSLTHSPVSPRKPTC